jgi:preprotein translocase subunit SecE
MPEMKNLLSSTVDFLKEVTTELKKVTWPSKQEVIGSTIIVCVVVAIYAVILGTMDGMFEAVIRRLI